MPSFHSTTVLALLSSALVASAAVLPNGSPASNIISVLRRQTDTIAGLAIPELCSAGCQSTLPIYNSCVANDQAGCLTVCESGRLDELIRCANCIYINGDRTLVSEQQHDYVEDQLDNIDNICEALVRNFDTTVDFIDYEDIGWNYTSSVSGGLQSTTAFVQTGTTTAAGAASTTGAVVPTTTLTTPFASVTTSAAAASSTTAAAGGSTGAGSRTNTVGGAMGLVGLVTLVALFV